MTDLKQEDYDRLFDDYSSKLDNIRNSLYQLQKNHKGSFTTNHELGTIVLYIDYSARKLRQLKGKS